MNKRMLIALALCATAGYAQKNLTIDEAIAKNRSTLAPARPVQLGFTKTAGQVYLVETPKPDTMYTVNAKGAKTILLTLTQLNEALKAAGKPVLKQWPLITFKDKQLVSFMMDKTYWEYNLGTRALTDTKQGSLSDGQENADVSPDGKTLAFTKAHNLYIRHEGQEKQISTDGSLNLLYGEAAHRNEFGIGKGTFFSPKGTYLAFYRIDQSMVTSYPIINWGVKPAKNEDIKYPFAGDKSHQATVGIYNIATDKIHYVATAGDPEQYLTNIVFSPDETKIYIAVVNRAQNEMQLNAYDAATGKFIQTLFEEKDSKYIEPQVPMQFVKNNAAQFIWQSNRDGYKHFYLYDINGKLIKQLTKGAWETKSVNGFDAKGEKFFFHANISSPVNQDYCYVNLKTGEIKNLTQGKKGFHTCQADDNKEYIIDYFSNTGTPREAAMINVKTGQVTPLFTAANPLEGYNQGRLKLFTIKNNENTDLYCRMFYPVGFDSTKKYPVVVYLYNGPHSQLVTNSWLAGADLWYHYMAQKGFIVFTLDGRGTDNRGKAFSQAIHRQVGTAEMEDQLSGVNYLKSLNYVDATRLGVHGWSYGGFMTISLMTRYPGVFKAAVAGGPVIDWSYYEIMYGERYMDSPQENKAGYDANNLLNHIQDLKGQLLIIHGTDDDVVVWQHSLMLLKKAVDKNVQLDYYVYPGHQHNVLGKDRTHLMDKISNYFIENL